MSSESHLEESRASVAERIRAVLIESTDIILAGHEPFVGWSAVLAERIATALDVPPIGTRVEIKSWPGHWAHRRKGAVSDGPFWEVTLGNGDSYMAAPDEMKARAA